MRLLGVTAVLVLLIAALAALAVSAGAGTSEEIVVTRDSQSLSSGCTPRETAVLLVRLAEAVTAGDRRALERLFAIEDPPGRGRIDKPEPYFRWYSLDETALYDRAQLFPYFARRHRENERWQLIAVDMGRSWIPGSVGIGYAFRRSAGDLPATATELAQGKGEIDCAAQRIFVWSMGQGDSRSPAQPRITPCPLPESWTVGDPIVACSRSATPDIGPGRTARAMLPDIELSTGAASLPTGCSARFALRTLRAALWAFNSGEGAAFARLFDVRGRLHAYTSPQQPLAGRAAITAFAEARHRERDGWTGAALAAPRAVTVQRVGSFRMRLARYSLGLLLSTPGKPLASLKATITFDCGSGQIVRWVGPNSSAP